MPHQPKAKPAAPSKGGFSIFSDAPEVSITAI
jgi:hypothetical protein